MNYMRKTVWLAGLLWGLGGTYAALGQEGDALLKHLQDFDAVYQASFSMSGVHEGPFRTQWQLSMSNGNIAYEEEIIEVTSLKKKGQFVPFRRTWFIGPDMQAQYDLVGRLYETGKLPPWPPDSAGPATAGCLDIVKPEAPTLKFPMKKALWSIGRGYAEHLAQITRVTPLDNGLLSVTAEGTDVSYRPGARWELVIDPDAAYMVRDAKLYRARESRPFLTVHNTGIKWQGSRCVPEQTRLYAPFSGTRTTNHLYETVSDHADQAFLDYAARIMQSPYPVHTDLHDRRMSPMLYLAYKPGELFPKGHKGQEEAIVFDPLNSGGNPPRVLPPGAAPALSPAAVTFQARGSSRPVGHVTPAMATGASSRKIAVAWIVLMLSILGGIGYVVWYAYGR
jgi:hypothetical protein